MAEGGNMSESMINKVARALWADRYPDEPWDKEATEPAKLDYLGHAHAAIEASRAPLLTVVFTVLITARNPEDRAHNQAVEQCAAAVSDVIDAALGVEKP